MGTFFDFFNQFPEPFFDLSFEIGIRQVGFHKGFVVIFEFFRQYQVDGKCTAISRDIAHDLFDFEEDVPMAEFLLFFGITAATAGYKDKLVDLMFALFQKTPKRWDKTSHEDGTNQDDLIIRFHRMNDLPDTGFDVHQRERKAVDIGFDPFDIAGEFPGDFFGQIFIAAFAGIIDDQGIHKNRIEWLFRTQK